MDHDDLISLKSRSAQEIANELLTTGLNQRQLSLLVELLAAHGVAPKTSNVRRSKRLPAIPLPASWAPSEKHYELAKAHGRDRAFVDRMAETMRSWATAKDERRANWDAVLNTFMMKQFEAPPPRLFNGRRPNGILGDGCA